MIGIFDSGIGGVTVFKEILKLTPNQDFIYYSDSRHNPYGDLSNEKIYKVVKNVVDYLISKGCVIIIIACNTASTVCVKKLREEYSSITFIATEPAYKMAHDYAFNEETLVMATKGTIQSEKFLNLYHKYNNNKTYLYSCSGLAELIEDGNSEAIDNYLGSHLVKYKGVTNVVLGCTHYPLIKKNIVKVLGDVNFFDGAFGISKELKRKLIDSDLLNNGQGKIYFIDSSGIDKKIKRFREILGSNYLVLEGDINENI